MQTQILGLMKNNDRNKMNKLFEKYASVKVDGFDHFMREEDFEQVQSGYKAKIKLLWILIAVLSLWLILVMFKW